MDKTRSELRVRVDELDRRVYERLQEVSRRLDALAESHIQLARSVDDTRSRLDVLIADGSTEDQVQSSDSQHGQWIVNAALAAFVVVVMVTDTLIGIFAR